MTSKLTRHIERATQRGKIVLMIEITPWHTATDCFGQLVTEYPDQNLKKGLALPVKVCNPPHFDFQIQGDREHMDETLADSGVLPLRPFCLHNVDLWEDFKAATLRSNHTHDTSGP